MRNLVIIATAIAVWLASPIAARTITDSLIESQLVVCGEKPKLSRQPLPQPLPRGFTGEMILVESAHPGCAGQYAAVISDQADAFYLGGPWFLRSYNGTPTEKIRTFGWERMRQSFEPDVSATPGRNGLLAVKLNYKTEYGPAPIEGWVDPAGTTFFPGEFYRPSDDVGKARTTRLQGVSSTAPTIGPAGAKVWVVEFSDFQCPSCKRSSSFLKPILEKYGTRIRYTRLDLPLTASHPWAFPAAAAGRAIHRQNPELFWKFKETIYEMQSELSIFTLEDLARSFVKDHDLDVARYDRDVASDEIRKEILAGIGTAFTLQVMGTPSFMVNGVLVDAGDEGKNLDAWIAKQLGS
ncbi:MAG TPA: thioredoxin domain-containing protein [Thermoanaerobaculia bacterium]|nr:thioredoxin domain-containing protein [Thermoanaerobaculia bacterium]